MNVQSCSFIIALFNFIDLGIRYKNLLNNIVYCKIQESSF